MSFLPRRSLASNWCEFMQRTSIIRSTQAARRFLRSVCMLMFFFQTWISTRTNTHVIPTDNLLVVYIYSSIISISFDTSHDIGIEISRKCSRCSYRYIPKISHDISRILDTIPNTTSKQFRAHTWGYASLPRSWLYTAYATVVSIVLGFLNPQHPEPAEST